MYPTLQLTVAAHLDVILRRPNQSTYYSIPSVALGLDLLMVTNLLLNLVYSMLLTFFVHKSASLSTPSQRSIFSFPASFNPLTKFNLTPICLELWDTDQPFTNSTEFYFQLNQSDQLIDVNIDIFSVTGQHIDNLKQSFFNNGFRVGPINWDINNKSGGSVSPGLYIANLSVEMENGSFETKSIRIAITP